jgi:hypothetical protein
MSIILRPLSTGEVLDRTFVLYRRHFFLFTGIAIVQVVFFIVGIVVLVLFGEFVPSDVFGARAVFVFFTGLAYGLATLLFYLIGYALATGATTYAVSKLHLGVPATIRGSYREMRSVIWRSLRIVATLFVRAIGALLITELIIVIIAEYLVRLILKGLGSSVFALWALNLLNLGLFIGGFVLAIRIYCQYSLAVPACLLEKIGARQALKRSKTLSRGALRRIFIVFFLMSVLALSLYYLLQLPAIMLFDFPGIIPVICRLLAAFIALTLAFPIGGIAVCLLYYDLRVRKEAFDLQLMMDSMGEASPPQTSIATPGG